MENLNYKKTLLSEAIDDTDFPIEPHAWGEMEQLIALEKAPKPPLSINYASTLFVLAFLGLGWWLGNPKNDAPKMALTTLSVNSIESPLNTIKTVNEGENGDFVPVSALNTPFLAERETEKEDFAKTLSSQNEGVKAVLATNLIDKSKNLSQQNKVINGVKTIVNDSKEDNSFFENTSASRTKSTELSRKNAEKTGFTSLVSETTNLQNADLVKGQNVSTDNLQNLVSNQTFIAPTTNLQNADERPNLGFTTDNSTNLEAANLANSSLQRNVEAVASLESLGLENVFSLEKSADKDAERLELLLNKELVPIQKLMKGPRQQIEIGIGSASHVVAGAINHFRVAFQYRLTPLFGIGVSTNYSLKAQFEEKRMWLSTNNLEALLYFVNRKRFDFLLSAGYGYHARNIKANNEVSLSHGKGFTLGLVTQYRPRVDWVIGLRFDYRELHNHTADPAMVLTFGRKF